MAWLLDHYILHALAVLAGITWGVRLERQDKATKASLRTLVRMIDRDLDEIRDRQDRQAARSDGVLEEIRSGVATILDQREK